MPRSKCENIWRGSFMKEDKFEQKIKSSLAEEIIPSEEPNK